MDSDKLGDKSMIGIIDPTRVNQASHTVTLNKNSEMYRNMSQQDFNKQVKEQTGTARLKVSLTMITYFLSKFHLLSIYQFY
jgi:hypothetical protein